MSRPKTPLGNKRQQAINYKERSDHTRVHMSSMHTFVGTIIGVSSPDKGFKGSKHDTERDYFKFLVRFIEQKTNRFVIPYLPEDYWYENIGWNEDSYNGMSILCKYPSMVLPTGTLRGVVDIGDVQRTKRLIAKTKQQPGVNDVNEYLVRDYSPYKNSYDFNCGAFGGIMDPTASFLISKGFS